MSIFNLTGKIALVTGGYGHLGYAMCCGLADFGATVYVLARSEEKFNKRFEGVNSSIFFQSCDILDTASIQSAFSDIYNKHNAIDILVNNAARTKSNIPLKISDEDWAFSVDGTLNSVYRCIRAVTPFLLQNKGGKVINIGSMYGMVAPDFSLYEGCHQFTNPPHYGAAKAGVIQLTKYFAQYLGPENIQVNSISPGPFPSESVQQADKEFVNNLASRTSLKRIGRPEDLIGAIIYLSSSASDFVTGHNLVVDGGWTIS
jgi:gluconate 5-dehydrogenase